MRRAPLEYSPRPITPKKPLKKVSHRKISSRVTDFLPGSRSLRQSIWHRLAFRPMALSKFLAVGSRKVPRVPPSFPQIYLISRNRISVLNKTKRIRVITLLPIRAPPNTSSCCILGSGCRAARRSAPAAPSSAGTRRRASCTRRQNELHLPCPV